MMRASRNMSAFFCACVLALLAGGLLAACEAENYDTGDGKYSNMQADFVEAYTGESKSLVSMVTDDGDSLVMQPRYVCEWAYTRDSVYRALVYYNKVEASRAEVLSAQSVLVPSIRPHYEVKDMHTDPVTVESAWKGRNGRYVNFRLNLLSGTIDGKDSRHQVGMVCDTLMESGDGHRHLHLRLFHNQNGVPEYYSYHAYLSVPLKKNPYRLQAGDTVSVCFNTYDGEVVKTFVY